MKLVRAKILENSPEPNNETVFRLVLTGVGEIAAAARPGQFVMVRVAEGIEPLLARPFSIHLADPQGGRLGLLYKVVGAGTEALSRRREGESLTLWGPLGRGFEISAGGEHILLAGGMGVAPLVFLQETLMLERSKDVYKFIVGIARRRELVGLAPPRYLTETSSDFEPDLKISEDAADQSRGFALGLATDHLPAVIRDSGLSDPTVYACGPPGMLRAAAAVCREHDLPLQVSLEASMACGVGACLGCAVKTAGGDYARVCREGPVFDARDIDWEIFR